MINNIIEENSTIFTESNKDFFLSLQTLKDLYSPFTKEKCHYLIFIRSNSPNSTFIL